jgi:hypothetical protein
LIRRTFGLRDDDRGWSREVEGVGGSGDVDGRTEHLDAA